MRLNSPRSRALTLVESAARPLSGDSQRLPRSRRRGSPRKKDAPAWLREFHSALYSGDFDTARICIPHCEADETLLAAQLAIFCGEPSRAVSLLKDRTEPPHSSLLGWALFLMNDRIAAASLWQQSKNPDENRLGTVLASFIHEEFAKNDFEILGRLAKETNAIVSYVASRIAAEICFARQDFRKAIHWARRADWILPRDPSIKRLIARSAHREGDAALAESRWQEIAALYPGDTEANENLGKIALDRGDGGLATEFFEKALNSDPFRSDLRLLIGQIAVEADDFDAAYEHFETALQMTPGNRDVLCRFAEFCWQSGKVYEAADLFYRLWETGFAESDEEENYEVLGYLLAETLLAGHDNFSERATRFFAAASAKYPDNLFIELYRARFTFVCDSAKNAIGMVKRVLRRAPQLPEAIYEMGYILFSNGDSDRALPYLRNAALRDTDPFYKKELGRCLLERQDWSEAERCFKAVLATGSEDEDVLFGLYAALYYQNRLPSAENLLRRILLLSPDNMQARCYLAELLLISERSDEARSLIRETRRRSISYDQFLDGKGSYELIIEPAGVMDWLEGLCALMNGKKKQAERALRKALSSAPEVTDWGENLREHVKSRLASGLISAELTAMLKEKLGFAE